MMMKPTLKDFILEQDTILQQVIDHVPAEIEMVLTKYDRPFQRICLVGSGTSLNAAVAAKYVMDDYNDSEVQVITPFDFLHYYPQKKITSSSLIIGISQTARSTGVIEAVNRSRQRGAGTIFVTANPAAAGAQSAEVVIDTYTGEENVGPKTKGFTSTMATLFYLAAGIAGERLDLSPIPAFLAQVIKCSQERMPYLVEKFIDAPSIKIIGYGPNLATAREGGLKILETIRIPVEVYDVEEYMHGPYHCLEKDTYMIFICPPGAGQERMLQLIQFVQKVTDHIIVLADEDFSKNMLNSMWVPIPGRIEEHLSPLGYIIPLQLLANDITLRLGRNPEQSRYPEFHATLGSKIMPQAK